MAMPYMATSVVETSMVCFTFKNSSYLLLKESTYWLHVCTCKQHLSNSPHQPLLATCLYIVQIQLFSTCDIQYFFLSNLSHLAYICTFYVNCTSVKKRNETFKVVVA